MSISNIDAPFTRRPVSRGLVSGVLVTALLHGGLVYLVYHSQMGAPAPPPVVRDLMVTKMVKLGQKREKFWLPRIETAPPPPPAPKPEIKLAQNPDAAPAPPPPVKPPPKPEKPEDPKVPSDLKRALQRAKMLAQAAKEEPVEGLETGSAQGTASTAEEGDAYATAVHDAIHRNWNAPSGLLDEATLGGLHAEVRVQIAESGKLGVPALARASGNELFDNSCLDAVRNTGQVPPMPATVKARFRRGVVIEFEGKDLPR
jgi:TonB family protein